jgi:hypothetical protein
VGVTTLVIAWSVCQEARSQDVAQPAAKVLLAYKFRPNDALRYRVVHDTEMTVHFNQAKQIDRHYSETSRHLRIVSVDPSGAADVEIVIDRVYLKAQRGESGSDEFDSDDPDTRATKFEKYKAIYDSIGQPQARLTLSPAGKVLKFTPLGQFKDAATDAEPVKSILTHFPEKPVAVGDKWSEEYDVEVSLEQGLKQKVTMIRKFRLLSVDKSIARIELKTGVVTPISDPHVEAQLIQRDLSGVIEFDLDRGSIVSRKHNVNKTVINPFGSPSSLKAVSTYEERLLPAAIAAKPAARQ